MSHSEDISERFWSQPDKAGEETRREQFFLDDVIQKAHLDREIESRLAGVRTVLDAGAGTGRFSIPLAARGLDVTHLDISPAMLDAARQRAREAGVADRMTFEHGRIGDLSGYDDAQFDLVICCDAPISYTYPEQEKAIAELTRVAARAVVFSVSSRLGYIPYAFSPLQKAQYLADPASEAPDVRAYTGNGEPLGAFEPDLDAVWRALHDGILGDPEGVERAYGAGAAPWPHNYLFLPDELAALLSASGLRDVRLSGPGALSRSIPNPILRKMLLTERYREPFLDLCYDFDSRPSVCGLGKDNLVASGLRGP
jgi:SAM-dependent methyltransferase